MTAIQGSLDIREAMRERMRLALDGQEKNVREADERMASSFGVDLVRISDKAREMQAADAEEEGAAGEGMNFTQANVMRDNVNRKKGKDLSDNAKDLIESIRKKIRETQQELAKATEALLQAQASEANGQQTPSVAESLEAEGGEGAAQDGETVDTARATVALLQNKLLQLQDELTKAMKEANGVSPGGGGQIQGTRAQGGCGSGTGGHIGEAVDPYAAAAAYEAAGN